MKYRNWTSGIMSIYLFNDAFKNS